MSHRISSGWWTSEFLVIPVVPNAGVPRRGVPGSRDCEMQSPTFCTFFLLGPRGWMKVWMWSRTRAQDLTLVQSRFQMVSTKRRLRIAAVERHHQMAATDRRFRMAAVKRHHRMAAVDKAY